MKFAEGCLLLLLCLLICTAVPATAQITANCSNGCYGPGVGADGLANTTVGQWGNPGNVVSYRFRAHHTGDVQSLHVYLIVDHAGYAAGTGGQLQVTFQTDDGTSAHHPSGNILATYVLTNPLTALPSKDFPTFTFTSPPNLVAGQLYHIVFKNVDANPSVNFVSVDAMYYVTPHTPAQPTISDTDLAELLSSGGSSWAPRQGYLPIYQLNFTDGWTEGVGYMEGWIGAQQPISGSSNVVREQFKPSGTKQAVNKVAVRLERISGSDPLIVRLQNGDGSVIEQGSIPASAWSSTGQHIWVQYAFNTPHTLVPGQQYFLELSTASSSTYQIFPIRKGMDYWFDNTTFYPDGYAQFKSNGSWVGWTQWGATNRKDGDLQFYFEVAGNSGGTSNPPLISDLAADSVTSNGGVISWNTDQAASGQVQYGTTTAYAGSTTLNSALAISHSQQLTGLAAGTLYHYRVLSANGSGVSSISGDLTFTTADVGTVITTGNGESGTSGGTASGFALTSPTNQTSATIEAGQTATYKLQITPNGFSGNVALSCSGAPAGASCTISPESVMVSGTSPVPVTVTVTTTPRTSATLWVPSFHFDRIPWNLIALTLSFLGMASTLKWKLKPSVALLALLILSFSGCAGTSTSNGGAASSSNSINGTPAGTSTLMLNATATSAKAACPLTLTIN